MAPRYIKLTICYDGSGYHGWQVQPGFPTIQETLNHAIAELVGHKVNVTGASRTDARVSALGQVGVFKTTSPIPVENMARAITDRLPEDMAVIEAVEVKPPFDVIGAVKSKLYRYTIFTGPHRPVLEIKHLWHLPAELDVEAMAAAARHLVGKKDFKSFASAADTREDSVRTVFRCDVTRDSDRLYVEIEGDGFLYNMVRNIVGTLVEVGLGRARPDDIPRILQARDRRAAGPIAPPQGLCLMWVKY